MNLKKKYRLKWKEIRYIMKNRFQKKFFFANILVFHVIKQYPNNNYNKFSINIPIKAWKKAVFRNLLKRVFMDEIYKKNLINRKISNWYWKIFVSVNKKNISKIKFISEIKPLDKKQLRKLISNDIKFFLQRFGG